ncbi:MAG: hypothetical protein ACXVRN_12905 [Solirubrobacteraceae bacterium]
MARARNRKTRAVQAGREEVLQELAPVISGSIGKDLTLSGTYGGHPVEVTLMRLDPSQLGNRMSEAYNMDVPRLIVGGVSGGKPWRFRVGLGAGRSPAWEFAGPDYSMGPAGKLLDRLSPVQADPAIERRLRDGGMIEAIERLGPRSKMWLPDVNFEPDVTAALMERYAGSGIEIPPEKLAGVPQVGGRLRIQVERDDGDPSPARLREILDAAVGIAELNAVLNPA